MSVPRWGVRRLARRRKDCQAAAAELAVRVRVRASPVRVRRLRILRDNELRLPIFAEEHLSELHPVPRRHLSEWYHSVALLGRRLHLSVVPRATRRHLSEWYRSVVSRAPTLFLSELGHSVAPLVRRLHLSVVPRAPRLFLSEWDRSASLLVRKPRRSA